MRRDYDARVVQGGVLHYYFRTCHTTTHAPHTCDMRSKPAAYSIAHGLQITTRYHAVHATRHTLHGTPMHEVCESRVYDEWTSRTRVQTGTRATGIVGGEGQRRGKRRSGESEASEAREFDDDTARTATRLALNKHQSAVGHTNDTADLILVKAGIKGG